MENIKKESLLDPVWIGSGEEEALGSVSGDERKRLKSIVLGFKSKTSALSLNFVLHKNATN